MSIDKDRRTQCAQLCRDFVGGVWKLIDEKDIEISRLGSSTVNSVFSCALPEKFLPEVKPRKLLLRFYGTLTGMKAIVREINNEQSETVIVNILAIHGLGPKIHGIFDGGRIESFIDGRTLESRDLKDERIVNSLIQQIAKFHSLDVPLRKDNLFFDFYLKIFYGVKFKHEMKKFPQQQQPFIEKLMNFNYDEEINEMSALTNSINKSKIVFSHNDLNLTNILVKSNKNSNEQPVALVDYDISIYNYRGFDLGYFLALRLIKIKLNGNWPFLDISEDANDHEFRVKFIQKYIAEVMNSKNEALKFDDIKMEVDFFSLIATLTFAGWGRFTISLVDDPLFPGAESYCKVLEKYLNDKKKFMLTYKLKNVRNKEN